MDTKNLEGFVSSTDTSWNKQLVYWW
jgi:hypothetical protein